jgi:hypothetical protein
MLSVDRACPAVRSIGNENGDAAKQRISELRKLSNGHDIFSQ